MVFSTVSVGDAGLAGAVSGATGTETGAAAMIGAIGSVTG